MHLRVLILAAIGAVAVIAGCGGSDSNDNPTTLSLKISDNGKAAAFQAPKTAKGGLVKVDLANQGKAPHGVQFIQYANGHTQQEVLQQLGGNSNVIPPWAKLEGGIGTVAPGQTGTATVNLPDGNYVLVDAAALGGPGPSSGPPATAGITLSGGSTGDLPDTDANVTAESMADDKFKWDISGLKTGTNQVTFDSKGDNDGAHDHRRADQGSGAAARARSSRTWRATGRPRPTSTRAGSRARRSSTADCSQTTTLDLKTARAVHLLLPAPRS